MDKITEIMTLIGVSPRDFARAASNFRSMPETELDTRLARLRAGEQRIETWRRERRLTLMPAAAKVAPPQELSTDQLWNRLQTSNALIDQHLGDLIGLIGRLERQGAAIPAEAAEAVTRMFQEIDNRAAQRPDIWMTEVAERLNRGEDSTVDGEQLAERLRESVSKNYVIVEMLEAVRRDIAPILNHPLLWSGSGPIEEKEVVDALARMENNVALHKPDVIVAVNDEGLGLSRVINADLRLNVPILRACGTAATGIVFEAAQGVKPDVVCVVGHVAWSGETLAKTMGLVSTAYGTTRVFGAVLIASNSAIERLQSQGPFAYHQAIEATTIDLGFDPATGFSIQQDSYFIGTGEDARPVTREGLQQVRSRIATDYQASIEFWK